MTMTMAMTMQEKQDTKSVLQFFGAGKSDSEGLALSGGLHACLPQKGIEQKVSLTEQRQDANR